MQTVQPQTAETGASVQYHFILTAQRPVLRGIEVATQSSTASFRPGTTRAEAYTFLLEAFRAKAGWAPNEGSVLFFSLEPDTLA